jgi:UDP-3-O-[3-hydroxymyristoyl] glucosamine N-acyltransferase
MISNKVILIGFPTSSVTAEIKFFVEEETGGIIEILDPMIFLLQGSDSSASYMVTITKDLTLRQQVIQKIEKDQYKKFTFIHKTSILTVGARVGVGSFIGPWVLIAANATIGADCLISPYCLISHNSTVGQGTVMQPTAMIAGSTTVGKYCKLNMRASIIDFLEVGDFVEIGAGSMLTKTTLEKGTYNGTPARKRINTIT